MKFFIVDILIFVRSTQLLTFSISSDLPKVCQERFRVHLDGGRRIRPREVYFDQLDVSDRPLLATVPGAVAEASEDGQGGGQQGSYQGNYDLIMF